MTSYGVFSGGPSSSYEPVPVAPPQQGLPPSYYENAPTDDIPEDFKFGVSVENAVLEIRLAFVRKVYSILAAQLGLTMLLSVLYMSVPAVGAWAQRNPWMLIVSFLGTIISLVALIWKRRETPINFYLLAAFTLFEAHSIATVTTVYDPVTVLQAVIITFSLFLGLTLFTFQTKYDFSGWQPFLYGSLWVLVIASLIGIFIPYRSGFHFIMAIFTAILFSAYIVYDTQQIIKRASPEEYILASVELYLDVINLFLAILRILDNRD